MRFKLVRRRVVISVITDRARDWREMADPISLRAWEEWDRGWRRRLGWRAGLGFWSMTNVRRSRVLVSRHWPHRLCWSWSVWVGMRQSAEKDGRRMLVLSWLRQYRSAEVNLFGPYLRVTWQDSDWMVAGSQRDVAPVIRWRRHLEAAEPAGRA